MTVLRPLHVLVVDDEDSFRMSLEIALKMSHKHLVESCDSGEAAMERLKTEQFDVVLLDNKLPELSGLDVLRWMQENNIDAPVIMLTGVGSEEVAVEAMKLGAYDYISKAHLDIDKLPLTISSVHERHLYRRELMRRQLEQEKDQQRAKEIAALQMFQNTVGSVGQFVNTGLTNLSKTIAEREKKISVSDEGREGLMKALQDLRHELEVISSGVKSMLDLSAMVTQKLEGIQNSRKPEKQ